MDPGGIARWTWSAAAPTPPASGHRLPPAVDARWAPGGRYRNGLPPLSRNTAWRAATVVLVADRAGARGGTGVDIRRHAPSAAGCGRTRTRWGASGLRDGQYAVDLEADAACLDVLYGAGYRVLSEESGVTGPPNSSAAPIVVVDPLDGSTNASRGVPWFASALCLVDDDGPAVGVVVNHPTRERFVGVRGAGAERDGVAIHPSDVTDIGQAPPAPADL